MSEGKSQWDSGLAVRARMMLRVRHRVRPQGTGWGEGLVVRL